MLQPNPAFTNKGLDNSQVANRKNPLLLQYTQFQQLPYGVKMDSNWQKSKFQTIIKFTNDPHQYVKVFYYNFLKLFFTQRENFNLYIERLFQILDDDEFKFYMPTDESSAYYLNWTTSKIKRMTSWYFKDLFAGKYSNVDQILQGNQNFHRILFLLFMSILLYCQKCSDFNQQIEFDTVYEVLINYFNIQVQLDQNYIVFPQTQTKLLVLNQKQVYLINLKSQEKAQDIQTSQSFSISNDGLQRNVKVQNQNQKLKPIPNSNFEQDLQESIKNKSFQDMTNRCFQSGQISSMNKDKKTQRYKYSLTQTQSQQPVAWVKRQYLLNVGSKNKRLSEGNDVKSTLANLQNQQKLTRLTQLASRRTNTQQSIYDDFNDTQLDEYSFLDDSIQNMKRTNEKKKTILYNQISNYCQNYNSQCQSLINKWYQLSKVSKNKSAKVQQLSFFKNPLKMKNHIQQSNQKPDFKKLKSRRRKSQQNEVGGHRSDKKKYCVFKKQNQKRQQVDLGVDGQLNRQKPRQFILAKPKKTKKTQVIYSKYGYVNLNVSQQFTDSLILKQLDQKTNANIQAMKQKAREQRQSIKYQLKTQQRQ